MQRPIIGVPTRDARLWAEYGTSKAYCRAIEHGPGQRSHGASVPFFCGACAGEVDGNDIP